MEMPYGITIKKTIALVNALTKLHNFCIDEFNGNSTVVHVNEFLCEPLVNMEDYESGFVLLV